MESRLKINTRWHSHSVNVCSFGCWKYSASIDACHSAIFWCCRRVKWMKVFLILMRSHHSTLQALSISVKIVCLVRNKNVWHINGLRMRPLLLWKWYIHFGDQNISTIARSVLFRFVKRKQWNPSWLAFIVSHSAFIKRQASPQASTKNQNSSIFICFLRMRRWSQRNKHSSVE